jgi:hypothetical protein
MINRNVPLQFDPDGSAFLLMRDTELENYIVKYRGVVNVKVGKPETPGTEQQNKTAHALLTAFYVSGMASIPDNCTMAEFKIRKKIEFGPCYEFEHRGQFVRIPKSWADYSKEERRVFIDSLISEITQSGALTESPKLQEIMKGMEDMAKMK